jgi:hypothetical protein
VLLITDLLGLTDVFPSSRSVAEQENSMRLTAVTLVVDDGWRGGCAAVDRASADRRSTIQTGDQWARQPWR